MNRKNGLVLLRLTLTIALILIVFTQIDFISFINQIRSMNVFWYLVGLACYFGFIGLWSVRWLFIIRAAGETTGFGRLFTTTLVGNFFALFLPDAIGSDLARMYGLKDEYRTSANIVSTVLVDRVVGLVSLILMALVALLVGSKFVTDQSVILLIIGLLVCFTIGWALFFNQRVIKQIFEWSFKLPIINRLESKIRALYESLYRLNQQRRLLITTLILSLVVQAAEVISVILVAYALDISVSPSYFFIFLPIVWLVTTIPISIGGLGVREGIFAFFFSQVSVASSDAVAISLLYYSFRIITGVLGGIIFLRLSIINLEVTQLNKTS